MLSRISTTVLAFALVFAGTSAPGYADAKDDGLIANPAKELPACCAAKGVNRAALIEVDEKFPWADTSLRNRISPISGAETSAEHFLTLADDDANVYGRIYFANEKEVTTTSATVNELYRTAFLAKDGKTGAFNDVRVALENENCPVSGGAAKEDKQFVYNGVQINYCCDNCKTKFLAAPQDYLGALTAELSAKLAPKTDSAPDLLQAASTSGAEAKSCCAEGCDGHEGSSSKE